MATRDLYINIRHDRNIGAFIKSHKDGSAYTLPSIFREEQVNLRVFFCEPNATGGLSSPLSLLDDLSDYSCRVGIGTPGNDTPLAVVTLAWNADGYFEGALNVNTTEMNTALDGASGSITKTFEIELHKSGEEFTFQQSITVRDEVLLNGAGLPSEVNDTLFADLLAGTLVDSPEVDYVRDGDDVESHIAVWRDASLSGQLRLECPPSSAHSTDALNDTGSTSVTVNGFNDRLYQLDLRVRGLCVLMNYTGGSQLGYVYLGGTYNHDTSDPWWIEISDPPQTVRLNATAGLPLNRVALDYFLSVTAKGGATITLHYDTQDGAISPYVSPIYVPGVAPYPDEFDGHFLELTLVNSNKAGITLADLDDGPTAAQRDSGGMFVKVKSDGSGLEYVAGSLDSHASSHASGGSDPVTLAQSQITNLTSDLAAKAPLASPTFTGTPAAPTAAGGTNTTQIATTAFVTSAVSSAVSGLLELRGNLDCSANPNYPSASAGDTYYCSVAGKVGGASGKSVDVGDAIVAKTDNGGGTEASVGTSWFVLEHNLAGALLAANNLSDVTSSASARSNLGAANVAGDTFTGQINFSGTNHAGIKLISLTTAQRDALTPANGMLIYNTTTATVQQRVAGSWVSLATSSPPVLYVENPSSPTTPVASGTNAIALGDGALAGGHSSIAFGGATDVFGTIGALASLARSIAIGTGTASNYGAIAIGFTPNNSLSDSPLASNQDATAIGRKSRATGLFSTAFANGTASGSYSVAFYGGTASNLYSFAGPGAGNTAAYYYSTAFGYAAVPFMESHFALSGNQSSQHGWIHTTFTTSNATPSEVLFGVGGATRIVLANNKAIRFVASLTCLDTVSGDVGSWELRGLIKRGANAASTTMKFSRIDAEYSDDATWDAAVDADTTNGALKFTVAGDSSNTCRWNVTVNMFEVT